MAENAQLLVMHERKLRAEEIKRKKEELGDDYVESDDDDLSYLDKYR